MERFSRSKDYTQYLTDKTVRYKKRLYNNTILCLDVETTSGYLNPDTKEIIAFDKSREPDYYQSYTKVNLLYEWTFGIEDYIVYGRTLAELKQLLDRFRKKPINFIIWAHNVSYEFMYLLNILDISDVFARKAHKIMYARCDNLEFRCTYMLTRLSLASWGKQEKIPKMVGDLDYDILRTPLTPLTKRELRYCEHDILIMIKGLRRYMARHGSLAAIPLTQTGEVRQDVKKLFKDDKKYHDLMTRLLPYDADFYKFLLQIFMGGFVHASYFYSGKLHLNVFSNDLTSAYPAEMALSKFPVTPWNEIKPTIENYRKYNNDSHSLLIEVELYGVKAKGFNTYIPYSKHQGIKDYTVDNGRIIKAEYVKLSITNLDLDIIESMYSIRDIKIKKIYMARNGYLDKKLVMYVLERFRGKNTLSGIEGMEDLYLADKQRLNSIFGLMVQKLVEYVISFDLDREKVWRADKPTNEEINEHLDELRNKPYKNFISYSQGIFITAKVRKIVCTMISKMDDSVLYADTDAIKFINKKYQKLFDEYNEQNIERIKRVSKERSIPIEYFMPKDAEGKVHILGNFEPDKGTPYKEFKTLGAKRYAYRDKAGEKHITVSGVNKEYGVNAIDDIDDFKDDMTFDYDDAKKGMLTYLYDMPEIVWNKGQPDEYKSNQRYGVHMQPARYHLSLSDTYVQLIRSVFRKNI